MNIETKNQLKILDMTNDFLCSVDLHPLKYTAVKVIILVPSDTRDTLDNIVITVVHLAPRAITFHIICHTWRL